MSENIIKENPEKIFRKHGGILRMKDALAHGITRYMIYALRDKGIIEQVSRGIYRLSALPPLSNPDLAIIGLRFPGAVICLISALSFHGITTQIPNVVSIAIRKNSRIPFLDYPPIRVHKFSDLAYNAGIQNYYMDNVPLKIYDPEKTIVDCFKFRNKIGMDVFLEALKCYRQRMKYDPVKLLDYGKICRIEKKMQPYLEALQ